MLTRIVIRNFKRFREVDIELGEAVVFIGANNSDKSSALQPLALWDLMRKTDYHQLARFVPAEPISPEVIAMLDLLVAVAGPRTAATGMTPNAC